MTDHVYFLLDEGKNRVRIGSTHNLLARLFTHLNSSAGKNWTVLGITEGGRSRETQIHALFADLRIPRESSRGNRVPGASDEWFRGTPELRAWIANSSKQWDRSDTFNWQSNAPAATLAMHGSVEWIDWFEQLAIRQSVGPGTLVERALALLAEQVGYVAPPPR